MMSLVANGDCSRKETHVARIPVRLPACCYDSHCAIGFAQVLDASRKWKADKSDDDIDLCPDYFIHACDEFFVHMSLLFSSLLVHGCVPETMKISSVIPIPKSKHTNVTDSANYRGIVLSSVYGKLLDLVLLCKFADIVIIYVRAIYSSAVKRLYCHVLNDFNGNNNCILCK